MAVHGLGRSHTNFGMLLGYPDTKPDVCIRAVQRAAETQNLGASVNAKLAHRGVTEVHPPTKLEKRVTYMDRAIWLTERARP